MRSPTAALAALALLALQSAPLGADEAPAPSTPGQMRVPGTYGAPAPSAPGQMRVPGTYGAPAPSAPEQMRVLRADEVDRYVAALDELTQLGLDASAQLQGDPSQLRQQAAAMKYGGEMLEVLDRHRFDPESFTEVHWNVLMAYLADETAGHAEEIERARAQQQQALAEMKRRLPPEQYEAAAKAMQSVLPALDATSDVPEANRKLVAARRPALEAIFEKARATAK